MSFQRTAIIASCFLWALVSCKKEPLPAAPVASPVFYMRGNAAGSPLVLEAGNEGYQMNPDFTQDSNGVYVLEGDLRSSGCADCYGIRILINDHMTSAAGAPIHIDSALKLGHYLYNDKSLESTEYNVVLTPTQDYVQGDTYRWTISENGHQDVVLTEYQINLHFDARQTYTVNLYHDNTSGDQTTHFNVFRLGEGVQPQIVAKSLSTSIVQYSFTPVINSTAQCTYEWDFGDSSASSDMLSPTHIFTPYGGRYTVTLTVTDNQQNKTYSYYQIPGTTDAMVLGNFFAQITPVPNVKAYSKVTVELTDPTGKVYSTSGFVQPSTSLFEIVKIDDYKVDSQNRPTKKYKALFNCLLRNGAEEIPLTGAEAVMAVSYK